MKIAMYDMDTYYLKRVCEIVNEKNAKNRVAGSVAAAALVAYKGAEILRVHDVKETVDAMNIVSSVVKGYI